MTGYDVIVIGGGPSAIITGLTGKKQHPQKTPYNFGLDR